MAVSIPGVVLSSLVFQLKNSSGDTVGFFLGERHRRSVVVITDADSQKLNEERRICIQWFVLIPGRQSFSDGRGNINFDKVEELLERRETKMADVIGWFSYRCNSTHRMSLLERSIHCNLMKKESFKKDFLFGMFTEQSPESPGLLSLEYSIFTWRGMQPKAVGVEVVNLKSTSDLPYQLLPSAPIPPSFKLYQDFVNENRLSKDGQTYSNSAEHLYQSLLQKLMPLKEELDSSVKEIIQLQEEISQLQLQRNEESLCAGSRTSITTGDSPSLPLLIQLGDAIISKDESSTTDSKSLIDLFDDPPPVTTQAPLIPSSEPPDHTHTS